MFDGKGIIVIKLRRFDNKASCSPESEKLYKVNMLVNIKGAGKLRAKANDLAKASRKPT